MANLLHEPAAFASRRILTIGAALLVSVTVMAAVLLAVVRNPHSAQRNAVVTDASPQPQLQKNPSDDLATYEAQKREWLTTYAWIDRKNGTVRIPIDRAMDIVARRSANRQAPVRQ